MLTRKQGRPTKNSGGSGSSSNCSKHMEISSSSVPASSPDFPEMSFQNYSIQNESRDKEYKIYFVLPKNLVESTCSSRLTMASQACQEYKLQSEWISEEDCLVLIPKKGNVFVLDPFEGEVFEYLEDHFYKSSHFMIIGPQCLRQLQRSDANCIINHRGHPMFTMGMRDIVVTFSGFRDEEKKKSILDLIQKMGGFYTSSYTKAVTHIVADFVMTAKCLIALDQGVPVMKPEWVEAVWKESLNDISVATDSHFSIYRCPIFHNVNVCFSQIAQHQKATLKSIIETNGGSYSAELHKGKTRVLIIPPETPQGEKFRYAKQWGVFCLRPEWITDSKSANRVLSTENYKVRVSTDYLTSTQMESKLPVPCPDVSCSVITLHDASQGVCEASNFNNFTNKHTSPVEKVGVLQRDSNSNSYQVDSIQKGIDEGQFLDGCRVYLSGVGTEKYDQVRKLISGTGATRLDRLNENVSHIVVLGPNLSEQEGEKLKNLNSKPYIVNLDWMVESAKKGCPTEEEEFLEGVEVQCNNSIEQPNLPNDVFGGDPHPEFPEEELQNEGINLEQQQQSVQSEDRSVAETEIDDLSQNVTKIFADSLFDIMLKSSDETYEIRKCIEDLGGSIVKKSPQILILPPVYTVDRSKSAPQLYTKFWVFDCQDANSPNVQLEFYHIPMKAFNGMIQLLSDVVIAISSYSGHQKKYISRIATAMGARFQDMFARKTSKGIFQSTHLICNIIDNDKYRAAVKWNVPVVRHEWLVECFHEQKKLDIAPFRVEKMTESRGSILMETPKQKLMASKGDSIYPATTKQTTKFKAPTVKPQVMKTPDQPLIRKRKSFDSDEDVTPIVPSQPMRMSIGAQAPPPDKNLKADPPNADSPYYKGLSHAASRQLKMALDCAASDSPSPDYSSIRIKIPRRNSTPEADAFNNLWQSMREKFPGHVRPKPPPTDLGSDRNRTEAGRPTSRTEQLKTRLEITPLLNADLMNK